MDTAPEACPSPSQNRSHTPINTLEQNQQRSRHKGYKEIATDYVLKTKTNEPLSLSGSILNLDCVRNLEQLIDKWILEINLEIITLELSREKCYCTSSKFSTRQCSKLVEQFERSRKTRNSWKIKYSANRRQKWFLANQDGIRIQRVDSL